MKKIVAVIAVTVAMLSFTGCAATESTNPVTVTVTSAVYANKMCMVSYTADDGTTGLARTLIPTDCFSITVGEVLPFDGMFVSVR